MIVAHAAAWPLHVRLPDQDVPAVHVIDWAADPTCAGAVHEVSGWASTPIATAAFGRAGFRRRDRRALSVFGDRGRLHGRALHIQMIDCDASFLDGDAVTYLT